MSARTPEAEKMIRRLCTRIVEREYSDGQHFRLDMRVQGLNGTRIALRDPEHPRWPDGGRVARTEDEALRWVGEYVDRLGLGWCRGTVVLRTVRDHGEAYLSQLAELKGKDSSRYRNHKNYLRNHVFPKLGDRRTRSLGETEVQQLIDGVRTVDGAPSSASLRRGVLAALNHTWRYASGGDPLPWTGKITVVREDANTARRQRARSGERRFDEGSGYTPDELRWILIAAMAIDLAGERNPKKRRGMNNTADLVAFLIHHMVRVEEVTFVRRKDVKQNLDCILVPGTKTAASEERLLLTQRVYKPWLDRLMASQGHPNHYLIPTSHPCRPPAHGTYKDKVLRALEAARLKRPGDLTHILRASHTSIALPAIGAEAVAAFSGRRIPGDDQLSDHYFRWSAFNASLPEGHWSYFPDLGTPEEVEAEAKAALRDKKIVIPPSRAQRRRGRTS